MRHISLLLICLLWGTGLAPAAPLVYDHGVSLRMDRQSDERYALDIHLQGGQPVLGVQARIGEYAATLTDLGEYHQEGLSATTAMLFLVDTSDPARQKAVQQAVSHISTLLDQAPAHFHLGLAHFDTELELLAPIGTDREQLRNTLTTLKAAGKTTELYRNTLGAVGLLSRYRADRKILLLFSDGLAEDQAYFHRDVVQAAHMDGVSLYTIGYAQTISQSVALQTLRRLSEDTGGQYLATSPGDFSVATEQLSGILMNMDSGRRYLLDLSNIIESGIGGPQSIDFTVQSEQGAHPLHAPITLPEIQPVIPEPVVVAPTPAPVPAPAPQVIVQREPQEGMLDTVGMYFLFLIGVLVIIILILAYRQRTPSHAPAGTMTAEAAEEESEPYAWIEIEDDKGSRKYPIRQTRTRIGRYRENDIVLNDPAISRYHAEIRYTGDGAFIVTDLGSKNGMLVNNLDTNEQVLADQDMIEIGDVRLKFVFQGIPTADMEETQVFKTQFPG